MRATFEQFFTPLPVAEALVELLGVQAGESVIDPSCGEGVFLSLATDRGARVTGVDLDPHMATMAQETLGQDCAVYVHDGLYSDSLAAGEQAIPIAEDAWDVVVGNPPFKSQGDPEGRADVLRRFVLGCQEPKTGREAFATLFEDYEQESLFDLRSEPQPLPSQAPEVLFLERFVQLARPGGRIGIVLPDGIVSRAAWQPARDFLIERCEIYAIIGLPRETFLEVGTEAKTVAIFARKKPAPPSPTGLVCLAEARGVGVRTERNDLGAILRAYKEGASSVKPLVLWKRVDEVRQRMTPSFYDPKYARVLDELSESGLEIKRLEELAPYTVYGQVGAREYAPNGDVQLLSIRNHEPTGVDFLEETKFVLSGSRNDPARSRVSVGDILISNSGVRAIGRPTLVTDVPHAANITQHMQLVRPDPGACAEAIVIFLQSRYGQLQIEQRITGVAAAGLTYDDIHSLLVPHFVGQDATTIRTRYAAMDREHQTAQRAKAQIAAGNAAPATTRRCDQALARAEELRQALVTDMEETVRTGTFSF